MLGGQTYAYCYDASGQRVATTGASVTYAVRGQGSAVQARYGAGGVLQHHNVVTPAGEVIGRVESGSAVLVYGKDHLGSVRAVWERSYPYTVTEVTDFYPFGLQMPGRSYVAGTPTRENYTGHELDDETGLLYAGARYLDPVVGRWMTVDPLADEYPGWSPYNYVLNNPLAFTDPNGMAPDPPNWRRFWKGTRTAAGALWQSSVGVVEMAASPGAGPMAPAVLGAGTVVVAHGVPSAGTGLADMVLGLLGEEGPGSGGVLEFIAREAGASPDVLEMATAGDVLIGFLGGNPLKVAEIPDMIRSLPTSAREARQLTGTAQQVWFEIVDTASSNGISVYELLEYIRQQVTEDESAQQEAERPSEGEDGGEQ